MDRFVRLPNIIKAGVKDLTLFIENFSIINEQIQNALDKGFYIEAVSLELELLDFWCKMYIVQNNGSFGENDSFGVIIKNPAMKNITSSLAVELNNFNNERIKAVHKYVYGSCSYKDVGVTAKMFVSLPIKLRDFVVDEARKSGATSPELPRPSGNFHN